MNRLAAVKTVWIVGASTGIGRALVDALAAPGRTLYVSARNSLQLEKVEAEYLNTDTKVVPLPVDVTDVASVEQAGSHIQALSGSLDLVVINAGVCEYIDTHNLDLAQIKSVFETNVFGALTTVKQALPLLRKSPLYKATNDDQGGKSNRPQLVIVSSSVTYQSLPRAGAYGGSKAALRYFAECLKIDLQKEEIEVRVVSPGFVQTPLTAKNDFPMPFMITAEKAAKKITQGLNRTTFDIAFPKPFIVMLKLIAALPERLRFKLLESLSRHSL